MSKSEFGFLKAIVRPIYENLSKVLDNRLVECLDNLDRSIMEW